MKTINLILIILISIIVACGDDVLQSKDDVIHSIDLSGKNLLHKVIYSPITYTEFFYDDQFRILKIEYYDTSELVRKIEYHYDENGLLIRENDYNDMPGNLHSYYFY